MGVFPDWVSKYNGHRKVIEKMRKNSTLAINDLEKSVGKEYLDVLPWFKPKGDGSVAVELDCGAFEHELGCQSISITDSISYEGSCECFLFVELFLVYSNEKP